MPRDVAYLSLPPPASVDAGGLPRGYRLREFVIEQVLAEGGFGVVYAAIDLRLQRRVAIKEYMPAALARRGGDFSVQPRSSAPLQDAFATGLRSFINEARLLAGFDHPALVRVLQFWEDKGTGFMVMPLVQAPNLRQWTLARAQPPEAGWLLAVIDRLLEALALVHGAACLHRDIAPDNILLQREAEPLLLDFGAARRVVEALTQTLTVIVKPGFAPIEQYAQAPGLRQGPWSDLYALCATLHYVLTRRAPPPAVARMAEDEYVPLARALDGRYPPALLAAIDAGLAVRPAARPQSVAEFRALLQGAAPVRGTAEEGSDAARVATTGVAATAGSTVVHGWRFDPPAPIAEPAHESAGAPRSDADDGGEHDLVRAESAPGRASARGTHRSAALADLLWRRPLPPRTTTATLAAATVLIVAASWSWTPADGPPTAALPAGAVVIDPKPILLSTPGTAQDAILEDATPWPDGAVAASLHAAATAANAAPQPARAFVPEAAAAGADVSPSAHRLAELSRLRAGAARPAATAARSSVPVAAAVAPPALVAAPMPHAAPATRHVATAPSAGSAAPDVWTAAEGPVVGTTPRRLASEPVASAAELQPIARPQPQFPADAARDGIDRGRVHARLHVAPSGRVERVEIVASTPRRVFDREVVSTVQRWRYRPPGEARQVEVEFLFAREG